MPADKSWQNAVATISPYIVKIYTPGGSGTGFLIFQAANSSICGVATAAHVIDHAHEWGQPIRLRHFESSATTLLPPEARAVYIDGAADTAVIIFNNEPGSGAMPFPKEELFLWLEGAHLRVGNEVGWVGFPAVARDNLCFFSGRVSCYQKDFKAYLIDGVAINGVSGGPTFYTHAKDDPDDDLDEDFLGIIGIISAYIPNRSTGIILPGVAEVKDVSKLHEWAKQFRTLDEAKDAEPAPSERAGETQA